MLNVFYRLKANRLHGLSLRFSWVSLGCIVTSSSTGSHTTVTLYSTKPLFLTMNYSRGKKLDRADAINSMIARKQLTPDGADWLTLRMDPYHDFQRPVAGYPDADSYDTVVSARNYEFNVSAPAGSAGNWDAHIFTLPFDSVDLTSGSSVNAQYTATAATYNLGLVNVAKDDAGCPLFVTADPVVSANFECTRIDTFSGIEAGMSRIIGMGIEIIDTTAAMYKQGALTAYSMPTSKSCTSEMGYVNSAATGQYVASYDVIPAPPSTPAEAVLYRSTVQWEASKGAYMTVGQQGIENCFATSSRSLLLVTPDTTLSGTDVALATPIQPLTALQAPPLITAGVSGSTCKRVNVTQNGIFLTGLANSGTFKVRTRVYLERAPQRGDSDLIPLATPSAAYDYKALALYSILKNELPICVPVDFNAKGDWWRWIVRTVGKLAPIIGTVAAPFVGPEAILIGDAVGQAAQTVQKLTEKRAPPKKPQPKAGAPKRK